MKMKENKQIKYINIKWSNRFRFKVFCYLLEKLFTCSDVWSSVCVHVCAWMWANGWNLAYDEFLYSPCNSLFSIYLQLEAVHDTAGRLVRGDPTKPRNVIDYIVFERHLTDEQSQWRICAKLPPQQSFHRQRNKITVPGFTQTQATIEWLVWPLEVSLFLCACLYVNPSCIHRWCTDLLRHVRTRIWLVGQSANVRIY